MTLNLLAIGLVVSLPVVIYGIVDLARIPARLYNFTTYSRRIWVSVILLGYACFGFGGILMVTAWLRSSERLELRDDLALEQRWEKTVPVGGAVMTRGERRRERRRRHRWAFVAVSLPVVVVAAATATRVS